MGRVIVIGSINVDLVVTVDRLPAPGETVLGGRFAQHHGGKGANQAVAAARVGAQVTMIGAVGTDAYGDAALGALGAEGIDVTRVRRVEEPTGIGLITVGPRGENQIAVAAGANTLVGPGDLDASLLAEAGTVLLSSLEIPIATVAAAVAMARQAGVIAVVNPAPAHALPSDVLAAGPILTPNEHELVVAIGNDDPAAALADLAERNSGPIVVTQGPAGALLADGRHRERFAGFRAPALVDTTGAGDTFAGVLAAWLAEGQPLAEAITAANAAGALSVATAGAREGMPERGDLEAFIASGERTGVPA